MDHPLALKLVEREAIEVHRVSVAPALVGQLKSATSQSSPAVLVTQNAAILPNISAGMIDAADIVSVTEGDWTNAILVVLNGKAPPKEEDEMTVEAVGDVQFLVRVERDAKSLAALSRQTLSAIRAAGVDGELVEVRGGRWVNRPLNTFTLKVQPRVGNLQFTLYGNPESYSADGFLLKDQNSYSRGWVRSVGDAHKLAELAKQSHSRRKR